MGCVTSAATLKVLIDNLEIVPGSRVTGKVCLSVNQNDVSCRSICCRILGQEATAVRSRNTHHQKVEFLDQRIYLSQVSAGKIERGEYEFPFQFNIPNGAPISMSAGTKQFEGCHIEYSIEAWLERPEFTSWSIKDKQVFTVSNLSNVVTSLPLSFLPGNAPVYSLCCLSRGDIVIACVLNTSAITPRCTTILNFTIENRSSVRVKAIEISVVENIRFTAHSYRGQIYNTLFYCRLAPEESDPNIANGLQHTNLPELGVMRQVKVNFSAAACSSYKGRIIHVEHFIVIKAITPFGTANPTIAWPIQVFS